MLAWWRSFYIETCIHTWIKLGCVWQSCNGLFLNSLFCPVELSKCKHLGRVYVWSFPIDDKHIRGLSGKFPNISRKNFPVLPWSYSALSPSKYSPLLCMHRCQRFFNVLKHSWKAVLGMLRKCTSEFVLIASVDSKRRSFSVDLSFGNRKKSAGARFGEYGGCGRTVVACLAKKSRTRNDECEGALSCWSIHQFSRHALGLFFLTASRRCCITSR